MGGEDESLISLIYEGVQDDTRWSVALAELASRMCAAGVGLGMQDMLTHRFRSLGAFEIAIELNPVYQRLAPQNLIWQEIGRRRAPLTDGMVVPKAEFERTELYADWFAPQGFHGVMAHPALFKDAASAVVVAFRARSQGDFEDRDLKSVGRFASHFGRALSIRLELERTARDLALVNAILDAIGDAIVLIDRVRRLLHANAAARAMLSAGAPIKMHQGRLALDDPLADARLTRLAAWGCGGELNLAKAGLPRTILKIHPCAAAVRDAPDGTLLVRIVHLDRDRDAPTPARLCDRLGLTPRQAEVVAELMAGGTEAEAAERLKLAQPTLHTLLRRVYARLDVKSRAHLLALLARHGFDASRARGKK